jgi:hypothetical protein
VVITLKNNQRENNFDNKKSNIIILIIIAITLIAIYYSYYTLNQKSVEKNQQSYLNHQKLQTTTIITSINNTLHDLKHHLESVKSMYGEIFEENDSKIYKSVFDSLINSHHNLSSLIYYTKDLNILYEYKSNHGNHQKIKDINSEWINSYLPIMEKNQRDSFIPMIYSDSENQYMGVIIPFYQQNELKSFFISVLDLNSIVNEFIDLANIPDVSEVSV